MNDKQKALAGQVRDIILTNPERHYQGWWLGSATGGHIEALASDAATYAHQPLPNTPADPDNPVCMTTGCVAGWAGLLSAPPGTWLISDELWIPLDAPPAAGKQAPTRVMLHTHYQRESVETRATRMLGLDEDQADWLFDGSRSRDEVLHALAYLPDHPYADSDELDDKCGAGEDGDE